MRTIIKKHKKKIIIGNVIVFGFLLMSIVQVEKNVEIFFNPHGARTIMVGETSKIDININTETPINAVGTTVQFPKDKIEIVAISKEESFFDLWTEDTTMAEGSGKLRFSGGTLKDGGFTGTGTVLTITIKSKEVGDATLMFENTQILASDGRGTNVVSRERNLTYRIEEKREIQPKIYFGRKKNMLPIPSPDLNDDGKVNFVDVSILSKVLFVRYNPRYDLNVDGAVNLSDLSIVFSEMFKIRKL